MAAVEKIARVSTFNSGCTVIESEAPKFTRGQTLNVFEPCGSRSVHRGASGQQFTRDTAARQMQMALRYSF